MEGPPAASASGLPTNLMLGIQRLAPGSEKGTMTQLRSHGSPGFKEILFFFLQQIRRLAGVLSFICSFISCTFKKHQRKTSTRHVFHCEAEPLSLGVPYACRRPPASTWTWTRFLGELGTWRDVKDTA
ncbi:hypothetical protein mRhiFer1_008300 [Rhinolophus ferrumequinum]|uniref:Uncharacterized protein n=1 Tax=Rhinolophus ferrumequinum TaxID=59479 RepID=A0A7J7VRF6_RHIFE|nr:hypothetical protein mRhiFer1_008300 [Rhinolophus ferrumequinum]